MITGDLKSKIDSVWNDFWSGGISNPLEVMEQLTYLLFLKMAHEYTQPPYGKPSAIPKSCQWPTLTSKVNPVCDCLCSTCAGIEVRREHILDVVERATEGPCASLLICSLLLQVPDTLG